MSKTVSFTLTAREHAAVKAEAAFRGLTPSAYAKNALASHLMKYGSQATKEAWDNPNTHVSGNEASDATFVGPERDGATT